MTPQDFFKNDLFAERAGIVLMEVREGYSKARLENKKGTSQWQETAHKEELSLPWPTLP